MIKTTFQILVVASLALTLPIESVLARGGRGGGSPSPSRSSSPSRSTPSRSSSPSRSTPSRSPTMSKPSSPSRPSTSPSKPSRPSTSPSTPSRPNTGTRPSTPGTGQPGTSRPGSKPSNNQLNQFLDSPGGKPATSRPSTGNSAVSDFLDSSGGRPTTNEDRSGRQENRTDTRDDRTDTRTDTRDDRGGTRDDRQSVRLDDRTETRSSLEEGRGERRTERQDELGDHADNIRNELGDHYDDDHLFDDFWDDHPDAHYHFDKNPAFWTWASFNTVQAFMPRNWTQGRYYDYGAGGNVYYEGDTVYVNEEAMPAEEYSAQAEEIATSVPEVEDPDNMDWLPLGVFAMTQSDEPDAVPNMFMQLALSKEGIIAGTFQNKTTGDTASLEGMVDQESQRAVWTIVDKNDPIMETGIENLTMNETSVLLHFSEGETQQWLMIRVDNPDASAE